MKNTEAKHLREHDELFWSLYEPKPKSPMALVNLDAHSDMSMFDGQLGIGNFISKLVDLGYVDEVIWLRDSRSIDFEDGVYEFKIGRKNPESLELVCSLENPFYFFQGSFAPEKTIHSPKQFKLTVVSSPQGLLAPGLKKWVLSVDYDYFACRNPGSAELAAYVKRHGGAKLEALYALGKSIKSKLDWEVFVADAEREVPGVTSLFARCLFPDFEASKEEIQNKVLAANRAFLERFELTRCLGLYSVSSLSSGYVRPQAHALVGECVDPWLQLLTKRRKA